MLKYDYVIDAHVGPCEVFVYFTPKEFDRAGRGMRFRSSMPDIETARMVAAAPDMLDALNRVIKELGHPYIDTSGALHAAKMAILKAEGK
jgi:hypothetical protein